ncbi:Fanconi anemia group G protein isoform X2 [Mixophyes fleayi]|uniref:Fanconi anemia group G protein isoform X2 n=1 Tax=Mixophyes fleayi TaxID=3061075 RepID=UPI003F4DD43B
MEVDCDLQVPEDESCLTWWIQDNNAIVKLWKDTDTTRDSHIVRQKIEQCYSDLFLLLAKIQGLPPTLPSLPLELTVLCNAVIMQINMSGGFHAGHKTEMETALSRVLEASGEVSVTAGTEVWKKVRAAEYPPEVDSALNRLAGLQCAYWLANNQLADVVELFTALNQAPPPSDTSAHEENNLLSLIQAWTVPPPEEETILPLQTVGHMKDILYTSAAFLQGVIAMDSLDFPRAVVLLQEAAGSLCSSRVLAEVYTCLGYSSYKMAKPQTALQYWKQALRVDFHCLAALYHSSCLYRYMGRTDSELEALSLLHTALENSHPDPSAKETLFLFRTELLLSTPILSRFLHTPTSCEVKYLMASRCLRNKSINEAVDHYMDLMAALQDGSEHEGLYPSPAPLPRMPVIYLEAATALLEQKSFQDAMTVCAELFGCLCHVTAGIIRVDGAQTDQERAEQLNCIFWASAAHLLQGEAQGMLGDHKESIIDFTKCINLLMKVQFDDPGSADDGGSAYTICRILKASAFFGRAQQFRHLGNHKNALMNVKLSLQGTPVLPYATPFMVNVLCNLGHTKEAASRWRRFQSDEAHLHEQWEAVRRDLPLYLSLLVQKDSSVDESVAKELEDYLRNEDHKIDADS